jgi:hypothetical protein
MILHIGLKTLKNWLGRVMMGLGDKSGARQAYKGALSQQLLYPVRGEVEGILEKLKR